MTLDAGTLNRRVSLQRSVMAQNQETEALEQTWVEVSKVWADIRFLNGLEVVKAATPVSVAKASIRIRFREDIDSSWRVTHTANGKTTIYNITAILPDQQGREYLDLAVETGGNNG